MSEIPVPTGSSTDGKPASGSEVGADTPEKLRLGGMALRNGLLIHGPTSWSAAARNSRGEIDMASGRKPDFGGNRVAEIPLLRGPVRIAEAFAVIPIARWNLKSSRLPFEDPRVLAAAGVASVGSRLLERRPAGERGLPRELATSLLGVLPATVALSGTELAAYHGVEHKAIAAYEQGTNEAADAAKEHERCGSNLIAPLMIFTAAGQLVLERAVERPGAVGRAAVSVVGLSLAVETFALAEKRPESPLGRGVHAIGDAIQRLFATREPDASQLEVGEAALEAILDAEGAER